MGEQKALSLGTLLAASVGVWLVFLGVLAGVAFLFTGGETEVAAAREIEISLTEFDIAPGVVEVVTDTRVAFIVHNDGDIQHDLTIGEFTTGRIDPGETARLDIGSVRSSGPMWCGIKGHRPQGMEAQLDVTLVASTDPDSTS